MICSTTRGYTIYFMNMVDLLIDTRHINPRQANCLTLPDKIIIMTGYIITIINYESSCMCK